MRLIIVIALFISGCSSIPSAGDYGLIQGSRTKEGPAEQGTYTQWNEEYAVTADHINGVRGDYTCDTGCDIKFIKKKARDKPPAWRNPEKGEKVTLKGISPEPVVRGLGRRNIDRSFFGVESGIILMHRKGNLQKYLSSTAVPLSGMSGGPVYGEDGSIIGIIHGKGGFGDFGTMVGIFVPHEEINYQWDRYISNVDN